MNTKCCYITLAILLGCSTAAYAQIGNCTSPVGEAFLDVNNVRAKIHNNGGLFRRRAPAVYTVPKDGDANALFTGTLLVGGFIDGDLRTSAAQYSRFEFWSGPLDEAGNPPAECAVYDRIWKVDKRDVAHFENGGAATTDLTEWPTGLGAPTLAADGSKLDLLDQPLAQRFNRSIDLTGGERPDFTGDQMLWWIMNDRGNEHNETLSDPIGIEVHATAFAFDLKSAPGSDATFYRYRIINRNTASFDSAFVGIHIDPDLGFFGDDYVGSDSVLNMAYTYNADNDDEGAGSYGAGPPAVGTSFVRGAIVPSDGDSAIVGGHWQMGYTNVGLTSFLRYHDGGGINEDPDLAIHFYRYLQARWKDGRPLLFGGDGFESNTTDTPTKFMYSGDPVTRAYWSELNYDGEGNSNSKIDARYFAGSGPFDMNPGDEQEIVVAITWARGNDHLDSVTKLRAATRAAKILSDRNFDVSFDTIESPEVAASPRHESVHLQWTNARDSNNHQDSYKQLFPFADDEYVLQGYRVYQFASEIDTVGHVLATYDIVDGITKIIEGPRGVPTELTAEGSDSGLRHYHFIDGLTNYRAYFFGVQPYATKNDFYPRVLDGPISRVEAIPARNNFVVSDSSTTLFRDFDGGSLAVEEISVTSDTEVRAKITDPGAIRADSYDLQFQSIEGCDDTFGCVEYVAVRGDEDVLTQDASGDDVVGIDGLSFDVHVVEPGFAVFLITQNAAGPVEPPDCASFSFRGFPHPENCSNPTTGIGQSNGGRWAVNVGSGFGSFESFVDKVSREQTNTDLIGVFDYEMRFTANGSMAWKALGDGSLMQVPFELWRTGIRTPDDASDDLRLIPIVCEAVCGAGQNELEFDIAGDHPSSSSDNDPSTDWVYWHLPVDASAGEAGYNAFVNDPEGQTGSEIFAETVLVSWNGGSEPPYDRPLPELGTVIRIVTNKPPQVGDIFRVDTIDLKIREKSTDEQRSELTNIGIVPNPYRLASAYQRSASSGEVRFTDVPTGSQVNIFALNGTKVRMLNHDSDGVLTWDLRNNAGRQIGSGMYLVHVDVPGIGSKVLKFGVTRGDVSN